MFNQKGPNIKWMNRLILSNVFQFLNVAFIFIRLLDNIAGMESIGSLNAKLVFVSAKLIKCLKVL